MEPTRERGIETQPLPVWLTPQFGVEISAIMGATWFSFVAVLAFLQRDAEAHGPTPWYGVVLSVVMFTALGALVVGLTARRTWGLVLSLGVAVLFLADAFLCPVSGHHEPALWIYFEGIGGFGLAGLSAHLLRRV